MPLTLVLQELVTVRVDAATPATTITQPESGWLDLSLYQDVAPITYIAQQGFQSGPNAAGTLYIEFAALREDPMFLADAGRATITANTTPSGWTAPTAPWHLSTGTQPFLRYVRWRLAGPTTNGTAIWTFRILLSVNPAPH